MTDINDIQIKADQYLENKEYQQAIDYFKKVRKQNLGISKIDYLIYRNAIEKYKYEKKKLIKLKVFLITTIYSIITLFLNKKKKFKLIESMWLHIPLEKKIIKKFITKCSDFKKYNNAIHALELVSEILKSDIWILKTLAYFYELKYDYPNELIIREKIIKLNSDDNNEKKLIENLKFKISDAEEKKITVSSLLEDIKHDPNNVDLHIQLANKYVNVRNFDSAIEHIEEYLKIAISENFRLKKKLFLIKEQNFNLQLAKAEDDKNISEIEVLNKSINNLKIEKLTYFSSQDPNDKQLRFELAKQLLDQNKFEQAIIEFENLKNFEKRQTAIYLYLSDAYFRSNNKKKSIELLKKASNLNNSLRENTEIKARLKNFELNSNHPQ
ncbi:MAG: hypothetical protein VYB95_01465 [Verrucomicrobiota bacterium]|nr:hypothetical protein [Verrucomicrobiota bacterium]